jgi:hypothetical protein
MVPMIKNRYVLPLRVLWRFVAYCLLCSVAATAENTYAQEENRVDATEAFDILFSHLDREIVKYDGQDSPVIWQLLPIKEDSRITPRGIGCRPSYLLESESYTFKDLLVPQLASLDVGENVIRGQCFGQDRKECYIQIKHLFGEEKSYFEIRFKTTQGKIQKDSLYCNITP